MTIWATYDDWKCTDRSAERDDGEHETDCRCCGELFTFKPTYDADGDGELSLNLPDFCPTCDDAACSRKHGRAPVIACGRTYSTTGHSTTGHSTTGHTDCQHSNESEHAR